MTTRRRRGLASLLATTALAAAGLIWAAPAAADPAGTNQDPFFTLDNLPIDVIDCDVEGAPGAFITFCIEMTFDGGTAKFGNVDSTIAGPIKIRQVVSAVAGPGGLSDLEIVIVDEASEGDGGGLAFPTIDVPGGIVGNEPLNDLLKPVTGVTAQIEPLADLTLNDLNPNVILEGVFGSPQSEHLLAVANLPFRVKVENLLLGDTCYIGSEADPVDLNLPLHLDELKYWNSSFADPQPELPFAYLVWTADATDATFDVPAGRDCGLLGLGKTLNELGLEQLNLFDALLNRMVGLPAASGTNLLSLQGHFGLTFQGLDGVPDGAP